MDVVRWRSGSHRPPYVTRISRWYDFFTASNLVPKQKIYAWAADGLDRFELPFFGGLASSFVDAE